MLQFIDETKEWFAKNYPNWFVGICIKDTKFSTGCTLKDNALVATGVMALSASENETQYGYEIAVRFPFLYPKDVPSLLCVDDRLPIETARHIMHNKEACLGTPLEVRYSWCMAPTLTNFMNNLVAPFVAWQLHYETWGTAPPWGERAHGAVGIIQHCCELLASKLQCPVNVVEQLIVDCMQPSQRMPCPCGSGLQLRRCHGKFIYQLRGIYEQMLNINTDQSKNEQLASFDKIIEQIDAYRYSIMA